MCSLDNIIEPNAHLWYSITYFFKKIPTSPPDKFESYDEFKAAIKAYDFAYASPDVLSRITNIEKHLLEMQ